MNGIIKLLVFMSLVSCNQDEISELTIGNSSSNSPNNQQTITIEKIFAATNSGLSTSLDGGSSFTNKTTADGLPDDNINDILKLSNGSILIATESGGASKTTNEGTSFTNFGSAQGLFNDLTVHFSQAPNGTIWLAGWTGLAYSTDNGDSWTNSPAVMLENDLRSVLAFNDTLYLGYNDEGIAIYDVGTHNITSSYSNSAGDGISHNGVLQIIENNSGDLVMSTWWRTTIANKAFTSIEIKSTTEGILNNSTRAIAKGPDGTIYLATVSGVSISYDGGLTYTDSWTSANKGFLDDTILGIYVDSDERFCIATNSGGISVSDDGGETFTHYDTSNNLGSNQVDYCIVY